MKGSTTSPPPFGWDHWYASVGGRSIHIAEVDAILHNIREYQYPKFKGEVNPIQTVFESEETAAALIKKKAFELGADYECTVEHPIGDSDVLHVPLALKAGFGELGRHGSIIHPKMGPLFRLGSVITDMPLRIDQPIDAGIAAFCDNCKACRKYCPANAFPISQRTSTVPFVCRCAFIITKNGQKISRASPPNCFRRYN